MPERMRAAVIHQAGGPDALQLEDRPIPTPRVGEVLIRIHAFGLNRSELFTRQGLSPGGMLYFDYSLTLGCRLPMSYIVSSLL